MIKSIDRFIVLFLSPKVAINYFNKEFKIFIPECEDELHSILEDWVLLGIKLGQPLPVEVL